jgi:hypothetical protein
MRFSVLHKPPPRLHPLRGRDFDSSFTKAKEAGKDPMTIQSVRQEIEAALRRDRLQNEVSKRTKSITAEFNLEYFGLSSQPDMFGVAAVIPSPTPNASVRNRP